MVDIHLDLKSQTVKWFINGEDVEIQYPVAIGDDIEYRVCVLLFGKNTSATLEKLKKC